MFLIDPDKHFLAVAYIVKCKFKHKILGNWITLRDFLKTFVVVLILKAAILFEIMKFFNGVI
jgi:hypothetical protein